jgi:hypothetical protein
MVSRSPQELGYSDGDIDKFEELGVIIPPA